MLRWPGNGTSRPPRLPRLTSAGRTAGMGSLLLGTAGAALGYQELLIISAAGVLALVVGLVTCLGGSSIQVRRTVTPDKVMRGDAAQAHLWLDVPPAHWRGRGHVLLRDRVDQRVIEARLPRGRATRRTERTYDLPTARRGPVPVGPVSLVRADPLKLQETEIVLGHQSTLLVYPKVYDLTTLAPGRQRDLEGLRHDTASGHVSFHALREYVIGDDLRLIHWRSTARTGTLMVREQADRSRPQSTVVLDTHPGSYPTAASFEAAVDATASVVIASVKRRFPVRLHTTAGLTLGGRAGTTGSAAMLDELARLQLSDKATLLNLAAQLRTDPGGQSLVVITGGVNAGAGEAGQPDVSSTSAALSLINSVRQRYLGLALVRFDPTGTPSAAWQDDVLRLDVPDSPQFAELWNQLA